MRPEAVAGFAPPLTAALADAAGVPLVVEAVAKAHRHRAVAATGWPVTRWLRRLRPDPLRRLRLESGRAGDRTSLPAASAVQRSRVETAIRDVAERAAAGLPAAVGRGGTAGRPARLAELPDALDRAVADRPGARRGRRAGGGRWARGSGCCSPWPRRALLWLLALFALDYLRLPAAAAADARRAALADRALPRRGGRRAAHRAAARLAAWAGGRRRARRTARRLHTAVERVGRDLVLAPVAAELERHRRFARHVAVARAA